VLEPLLTSISKVPGLTIPPLPTGSQQYFLSLSVMIQGVLASMNLSWKGHFPQFQFDWNTEENLPLRRLLVLYNSWLFNLNPHLHEICFCSERWAGLLYR
jgi:hypothetical protein